jgi:hypothetical protein
MRDRIHPKHSDPNHHRLVWRPLLQHFINNPHADLSQSAIVCRSAQTLCWQLSPQMLDGRGEVEPMSSVNPGLVGGRQRPPRIAMLVFVAVLRRSGLVLAEENVDKPCGRHGGGDAARPRVIFAAGALSLQATCRTADSRSPIQVAPALLAPGPRSPVFRGTGQALY